MQLCLITLNTPRYLSLVMKGQMVVLLVLSGDLCCKKVIHSNLKTERIKLKTLFEG